jgi:hypothetical protein
MVLVAPLFALGRHKTILGEFLIVAVFAGLVVPMGAAAGVPFSGTLPVAGVWSLSFSLGTLEVHAIKARNKASSRINGWTRWASPFAAITVLAGVAAAWILPWTYRGSALAAIPPAAGVLTLSALRVRPKNLKRVGWTMVGANALCLILLLAFG